MHAIAAVAVSTIALVAVPAAAAAQPQVLSGHQIVLSPTASVPPGGATSTYAQCPGGTHVVGGGLYADHTPNPRAVVWRSSYPAHLDGADRWGGQVHNTGQQAFTLRAYAVCLGGLAQHEMRKQTVDIAPGQPVGLGAGCPDPTRGLGGGFDVETGWGFTVSGVLNYATSLGEYRGPKGQNTSGQSQRWTAHVVCGSGGVTEVRTVELRRHHVNPGVALVDLGCPAGMAVLGGGGGSDDSAGRSTLLGSYPLSSTQWRTILRVDDPAGADTEAWASCAR